MKKGGETAKQTRIVIEHVSPSVDGGLFAAKTSVGDIVPIEADVFTDGHDLPAARVLLVHEDADRWDVPMVPLGNDHWRSEVPIRERGTYRFRIEGWIDTWATWRSDLEKRLGAGQDVAGELREGAALVGAAARSARAAGGRRRRGPVERRGVAPPPQGHGGGIDAGPVRRAPCADVGPPRPAPRRGRVAGVRDGRRS